MLEFESDLADVGLSRMSLILLTLFSGFALALELAQVYLTGGKLLSPVLMLATWNSSE